MRTAHSIHRTGFARVRGQQLIAANEPAVDELTPEDVEHLAAELEFQARVAERVTHPTFPSADQARLNAYQRDEQAERWALGFQL